MRLLSLLPFTAMSASALFAPEVLFQHFNIQQDSTCMDKVGNDWLAANPECKETITEFSQAMAKFDAKVVEKFCASACMASMYEVADQAAACPGGEMFKPAMDLMCTQNLKGDFCFEKFLTIGQTTASVVSDSGASAAHNATCNLMEDMGCCLGSLGEVIAAIPASAETFKEHGGYDKALKKACGWSQAPKPCPKAGQVVKVAKAKVFLKNLKFEWLDGLDATTKDSIVAALRASIAAKAGIGNGDVTITKIEAATGGTNIEVSFSSSDESQIETVKKALEAGFPQLDAVAGLVPDEGKEDASAAVEADGATVEVDEKKALGSGRRYNNGVGATGPSMLLLAALSVVVAFV